MMFVHLEQNGKKRSENTEGTDTMAERRMFTKKIIDSDAFLDAGALFSPEQES